MGVKKVYINNGIADKEIIKDTEFNEFGQIEKVQRGNGNTSYYTYDIKGRLKNLQTTAFLNNTYYKLQDVDYTFKVDNSIKQLTDSRELEAQHYGASSVTYTYQYDGLNRLVHAAGAYNSALNSADNKKYERAFGYAANGNLLKKEIINPESHVLQNRWNYTYSNHAATGINTTQTSDRFTMHYDAVGNMIYQSDIEKNVVKESTFDSQNRIMQVTDGSETIGSYWYDDQGFRIRKIGKKNFGGTDGLIEVLYPSMYFGLEKQRDADGTLVPNTEYAINNIYLNGIRIAAVMPDGTAQYYLTDQVDSVKVYVLCGESCFV